MKMISQKDGTRDTNFNKGDRTMKEERNVNIDLNNSVIAREYIAYLERKDEIRRKARKDFWTNVGTAVAYIFLGAGISTIVTLAVIGLAVIL